MAYCPDLEPTDDSLDDLLCKSVGWLWISRPFPRGSTPPEFRAKLRQICLLELTFVTMGSHECEFCGKVRLSSELEVPGRQIAYRAPDMIAHYVEEHEYLPPQEFIDAVLASPPPGTDEYRLALRAIWSLRVHPGPPFPLLGPNDPFPNTRISTSSVQFPVLTLKDFEFARRNSIDELSYGRVHDLRQMRGYEFLDSGGRRLFVRSARESKERRMTRVFDRVLNPLVHVDLVIDLLEAAVLLPQLKAKLIKSLRKGHDALDDKTAVLLRRVDEASDVRGVIEAFPPRSG